MAQQPAAPQGKGLADLLIREKFATAEQVAKAQASAKSSGEKLVDALVSQGVTDEQTLMDFFSKQYRLPIMDLSSFQADPEVIKIVPQAVVQKHGVLPVGKRGDTLVVAVSDPTNVQAMDDIRFQVRLRIEQVLALPSVIKTLVENLYGVDIGKLAENITIEVIAEEKVEKPLLPEDEAPIIQFVQAILSDAIRKKASDIHVEPYEKDLRIRFRIDGDLVEALKPPANVKQALIARIKVMAKMRLDEKRLPQDGRVRLKLNEYKTVDFRVNTLPTIFGEKICLRILDKSNAVVSMDSLGFEKDDLAKFIKAINEPYGICLVTGATGSGKTTTLYAGLNALNKPDVNISTIEDPVEYNFHGINQVQTKEQIGLTFAETLKALLRQDPDIILLGEIRDKDTAEIAFKAALTGHLVLSTLHTNDAPSTIMRLKDMGVDTFLINSALHLVVAQKLVRRVCKDCKIPDDRQTPETLAKAGFPANAIGKFQPMRGKGCATCRNTGFKGRAAVHELLVVSEKLKEMIGRNASTEEIRKQAIADGMKTLKVNTMRKIVAGIVAVDDLQYVGGH